VIKATPLQAYLATFFFIAVLILMHSFVAEAVQDIDDLVLRDDVILCKKCHKEHAIQWPQSGHAGSFSDRRVLQELRNFLAYTQNDSPQTAAKELEKNCLSCHAPQTRNATDTLLEEISGLIITAVKDKNSAEGQSAMNELAKISIDCYVCHMLNGMPEGEVRQDIIYGPGWDEDEESHTRDHGFGTVKSDYLISSKMCTRCHHDWPAGTPAVVRRLHKNYSAHYVEKENSSNKVCQECHMMDNKMIVHNMPVYGGALGFSIKKAADKIGAGLAGFTLFGMVFHISGRRVSSRRIAQNINEVEDRDIKDIMASLTAEATCLPRGEDDSEEKSISGEKDVEDV
jgi:mono/diheme cytochrome c family protein